MKRDFSALWYLGSVVVVAVVILIWQLVANTGVFPRAFFPGPDATWQTLHAGVTNGDLIQDASVTIRRMAIGWVLASLIGIILGGLIGLSRPAQTYLAPFLEALRPLPASALAPVAILIFGLTEQMILVLIAFGALWPMLLTVIHGVASVHERRLEVSHSLGLSRLEYAWKVALPSSMPDILGGLKMSLTVALILAVVGEMITVNGGLGSRIILGARRFNAADIYAGVLVLGAIGFTTNAALAQAERYFLKWQNTH